MSKFKRYERYKDSGVEWIGEIPEHWEIGRLKNSIKSCRNGIWGDEPQGDINDVACIRVVDFNRTNMEIEVNNLTIRNVPVSKQKMYLLKRGDLLIEKSGGGEKQPVGFVTIFNHDIPAVYANFIARMELEEEKVYSGFYKYVHYAMYSVRLNVKSIKQTTGIQNLDINYYFEESVIYPPLNEQKIIANFLDQKTAEIDALIADKEKFIELLQEKRQAIITETVTKGLNPNVKMKDSGIEWIGEIPEHWNLRRIKYLANIRNVKSSDSDIDKTYVGLENIESKTGKLLTNRDDEQQFISETANIFKKGDVLFGKLRPYLAKCIIADFDGRCTSELLVLKTTSYILPEYLHFFMLSPKFIDVVNSSTYGAKMPRASWDFIGNLQIPLPSIKEQEEIVEYLTEFISRIDDLIFDINNQVQKLKEYCQSLISEAVTGKIDVRDYYVNN
jgi:type I restriction enzyme S subunit